MANILIVQQAQSQRNFLTIEDVTNKIAEGEDGEGGFWFWVTKDDFCTKWEIYYDVQDQKIKKRAVDSFTVDGCTGGLGFNCSVEDCPKGYERS
ncbi:MAG: hypothetical protein J6T70_17140 [Bacteroidales bacterium]|nr:hypothetical protein [Bacteroidales bacterium]